MGLFIGGAVPKCKPRWKNGIPCRCSKCGGRKTLAMHPDHYHVRAWTKCKCGGEYRPDNYRRCGESRRVTCHCGGYHFPHRRGSTYCHKGALGARGFAFFMRNSDAGIDARMAEAGA